MTVAAPARVDWIERQILSGSDLGLAHRYLDILRARHMRGAHATWGVALGLSVRFVGARLVEIGEGLAYDARGRELLLSRPVTVPVADVLPEDEPLVVALRSVGDHCVPQWTARIVRAGAAVRPGLDVPIAILHVASGAVDVERRPHVRSLAPPRIAAGTLAAAGVAIKGSRIGFTAEVDTSRAGFIGTPIFLVQASGPAANAPAGAIGPLLAVRNASADGFDLEAHYVFPAVADYTKAFAKVGPGGVLPFAVTWLGVEAPSSCGVAPAPDPNCPCLV